MLSRIALCGTFYRATQFEDFRACGRAAATLSWLERFAALQAKGSVARRDQSTKRAHPLRREIAVSWCYPKRLSQRRSHEGAQTTKTAKKRLREGSHD